MGEDDTRFSLIRVFAVKIKTLEIQGYRSFQEATWNPGNLNLVVGPNGSGKSNLLSLLQLISKTAEGELANSIAEMGGMIPILWDHRPGFVGWNLTGMNRRMDDSEFRDVQYEIRLQQLGSGSAYMITRDNLTCWNQPDIQFEQGTNSGYRREKLRAVVRGFDKDEGISETEKEVEDENESYLSTTRSSVRSSLMEWTFHSNIHVGPGSTMRRPTTTQHVTRLESCGANLVPVLHTLYTSNREFKDAIDQGMRAGFGREYDGLHFQPAAAQQVQLAIQWQSSTKAHAGQDLSDGTLRFIFLLTALAHPNPPPILAIEEPEVGLHPSMLAIIAEYAAAAAEKCQVIITTHSPEFLDAFTSLSPVVTLCNWADGQTSLYTLDSETLEVWLKEYRLGHLFTSGELESLASDDVAGFPNDTDPFVDLPEEGATMTGTGGDSAEGNNV